MEWTRMETSWKPAVGISVRDDQDCWRADIRVDGCVHLWQGHNGPIGNRLDEGAEDDGLVDYMHLCSLNEMIDRLVSLREVARSHYGPHWR